MQRTAAQKIDAFSQLTMHLGEAGMIWVPWPKGRGLGTDLTLQHAARRRTYIRVRQLSVSRSSCNRIDGNAGSLKPAAWYMLAPSGVALRWTTRTPVSVWNQVRSAPRHACA